MIIPVYRYARGGFWEDRGAENCISIKRGMNAIGRECRGGCRLEVLIG